MEKLKIRIEQVDKDLPLPKFATKGSVAVDLYSAETFTLNPRDFKKVSTGIKLAVPEGYEGQVRPRSGLAAKNGISIVNTPGTLDSDYRGILYVILINHGYDYFHVKKGDRIAQLVINKIELFDWEVTEKLDETERGEGGLGHTGV
ncbi:dUTP diphosphatase [Candidatus Woesearchaeota archaeon]|nr:dUTP diphosphatase [Candidatus Woesearchaeota archaeon]